MKHQKPRPVKLIQRVMGNPNEALTGRSRAVRQLAALGSRGVTSALKAMKGPFPPDQYPRDVVEALARVLHEVAKSRPELLVAVLERQAAPADPQLILLIWALADAPAKQVISPLQRALKNSNQWIRWAAASTLVSLRAKSAIGSLVEALRDRSSAVQFVVVDAMRSNKLFRTPAAIEPLRKIVANERIRQRSPGMWRYAGEVLAKLGNDRPVH